MQRYRERSAEVEAVRVEPGNLLKVKNWVESKSQNHETFTTRSGELIIFQTSEGSDRLDVPTGAWIVCDANGRFRAFEDESFLRYYEKVPDA